MRGALAPRASARNAPSLGDGGAAAYGSSAEDAAAEAGLTAATRAARLECHARRVGACGRQPSQRQQCYRANMASYGHCRGAMVIRVSQAPS